MNDQPELIEGARKVSHANRGRELERMLERTHEFYERRGTGSVEKIPIAFGYCTEGEWRGIKDPALKARTGDDKPLKREKTSCDYKGHERGYGVAFDAKEFAGSNIPHTNFKPHQVRRLYVFERTGGKGGFVVWAKRIDSVFWVSAEKVMMATAIVNGPKSFNLDWLTTNAVLICNRTSNAIIDWAAKIIPKSK